MNKNPIDWSTLDLEELHKVPTETIEILVRKIQRMRIFLTSKHPKFITMTISEQNEYKNIFFDYHVTDFLEYGEKYKWPRDILERLLKSFYMAMPDDMRMDNKNLFRILP